MGILVPEVLKVADEIVVIAVSEGLHALPGNLIRKAVGELESHGLKVTVSDDLTGNAEVTSDSIIKRAMLLNDAFANPSVKAVLIGLGGVSAIEILPYIDFELIKKNPKPLCGFSDATIVLNAIYARTGLITYYGPMLFSFVANADIDYTWDAFKRALFSKSSFEIKPAVKWGNYNELKGERINTGFRIVREGSAVGRLTGGHVPSFNLLQGTPYFPSLEGAVLFVEICERYGNDTAGKLKQYINALLLQNGADKLKGLMVGRFYHQQGGAPDDISDMLLSHALLQDIPVITNVDIGHTTPMVTLPIGGQVRMEQGRITIEAR
ncbi:Muramoyltetrapeptide carboxypeptidase LdcA (peptidoglycan recycling) [Chitinophaga eiseniae]|uniref:Muramoyltetrapeptide carboxypeptidase LdcA (Peptidoglycan recycling) n=1 Tax=Chitinophaga eiseniae TaxID=634771 RepID=A0A1T4U5Y7_9BACT|nr:S66 peptidase family protein [Chitinophaga eiseniae]SKA48103.1 Muramoyltetrapeptide carboxypeptidase LdcA (peptidoglycan recycling) [Chitinophaga eiseniae]